MPTIPQVTNTLNVSLKTTDNNDSTTVIEKSSGDIIVPSIVGQYTQKYKLLLSDTPLPFTDGGAGTSGGDQIYIKNTDPGAIVTVKWTKQSGGGIVSVALLQPGGVLVLWNPTIGNGVSAVTAASTIAGSFIDVFQGVISFP